MRILVALAFVVTSLSSQVVSPRHYERSEANSSWTEPFGGNNPVPYRYQQVHDALSGSAMTIQAIAFRPEHGASTASNTLVADLSMSVAASGVSAGNLALAS